MLWLAEIFRGYKFFFSQDFWTEREEAADRSD
jgi:frataxin-like iron-binding protein CyaY